MTEKIVGRQYVVVGNAILCSLPLGTVVTLIDDDGSEIPHFSTMDGTEYIYMGNLLLLAETAEKSEPKPKYTIGQEVTVTGDTRVWHGVARGETVTINALFEYIKQFHCFSYRVICEDGMSQILLETQLEPVKTEKPQFIPEVGQFYFADGTGHSKVGGSQQVIIKLSETQQRVVSGYKLFLPDRYSGYGYNCITPEYYNWTPATDEQKIQLLTAMAEHGDATEEDLGLLSELMPMDNPELSVGEVYYRKLGAIIRAEHGDTVKKGLTGNYLEGGLFLEKNGVVAPLPYGYRKALPHEVAKLEAAEKAHGCVYQKQLVNAAGTVIEAGKYYRAKDHRGTIAVFKVESVNCAEGVFYKELPFLRNSELTNSYHPLTSIGSLYGKSAVPATAEEIALLKRKVAAENFTVDDIYAVTVSSGESVYITVTRVSSSGEIHFMYRSQFGDVVESSLPADDSRLLTAVEKIRA